VLDLISMRVNSGSFDFRNGHAVLCLCNLLVNLHEQMTMRGKLGPASIHELRQRGLINFANYRCYHPQFEMGMLKSQEVFLRAAQQCRIFTPYFFQQHKSKDGKD
jgi:hypothetical protein